MCLQSPENSYIICLTLPCVSVSAGVGARQGRCGPRARRPPGARKELRRCVSGADAGYGHRALGLEILRRKGNALRVCICVCVYLCMYMYL